MDLTSVDLDDLGLLKTTHLPKQYEWLSDNDKNFLLRLLMAGPEGLTRKMAEKEERHNPDVLLRLEARQLTTWERDQRGQLTFYCLTAFRGQEVAEMLLQIARNSSHKTVGGTKPMSAVETGHA